MLAKEFINEGKDKDVFVKMFHKFLPLAMKILKISTLPTMKFELELNTGEQPSFGMYANNEKTLYVALSNRHPVDILRTVAHELVHYKQDINGELNNDSGRTGSPEENQAHEIAGVIMRHFNKQHSDFLKSHPIIAEGIAIEPDPQGYQQDLLPTPKNTLVIDTPSDLDWYKIGQHYPVLDKEDPHEYGQSDSDMTITPANRTELEILKKNLDRLKLRYKEIGGTTDQPEIHDKLEESAKNSGYKASKLKKFKKKPW
jgi:hypothetical protein